MAWKLFRNYAKNLKTKRVLNPIPTQTLPLRGRAFEFPFPDPSSASGRGMLPLKGF